jgi:WD40 repeat protein
LKNKRFILFFLLFASILSNAQEISISNIVTIKEATKVSADRYFNIYVVDNKENIQKYDPQGNFLLTFSPSKQGEISLLESWNSIRIFAFYRDFQEFVLLDRFLVPQPNYKIDQNVIGFARMATISADNQLWVIDDEDFSLKKYDLDQQKVSINTPLELVLKAKDYHINFMREYQNLLFVNDKNSGILVFDNMGNYKKKIALSDVSHFSFINDELYYLKDNKIMFFNVYTFAERSISLPIGYNITNVIVSPEFTYLFSGINLLICK